MMTQQELEALVALLNRVPMSTPEQLWVQAFVARIAAEVAQQERPAMQEATDG